MPKESIVDHLKGFFPPIEFGGLGEGLGDAIKDGLKDTAQFAKKFFSAIRKEKGKL